MLPIFHTLLLAVEATVAFSLFRLAYGPTSTLSTADKNELDVVRKYGSWAAVTCAVFAGGTNYGVLASVSHSLSATLSVIAVLAVIFAAQRTPQLATATVGAIDDTSESIADKIEHAVNTFQMPTLPSAQVLTSPITTGWKTVTDFVNTKLNTSSATTQEGGDTETTTDQGTKTKPNLLGFRPLQIISQLLHLNKKEVNKAKAEDEIASDQEASGTSPNQEDHGGKLALATSKTHR